MSRPLPLRLGVFVLLLLAAAAPARAESLTEAAVERLVESVAEAVADKDPEALARHFSADATFDLTSYFEGESQQMSLDKAQYITVVAAVWASYEDYDYEIVSLEMERLSQQKMKLYADIAERIVIGSQELTAASKEIAIVELIDGNPLITEVIAHSRIEALTDM